MNPGDIKGHLVLLMAPSGSGKKALVDGLGELKNEIYFAKTYTSRARREGTEENPKYHFISRDEFTSLIENDSLIEWAEFGGNYYGTPKSEFLEPLQEQKMVFKEMELQGVEQIQKLIPKEHVTVIYVDAGGWESLRERITARAAIEPKELALREERYRVEAEFKNKADIVISNKNGELEKAQQVFREVIKGIIDDIEK